MSASKHSISKTVQVDLKNPPKLTDEQKARLEALSRLPDEKIDYSDAPFLPTANWTKAMSFSDRNKKQISLRIDADVLDFFKSTGKRYQTRMNAVLRGYMAAQNTNSPSNLPLSR